MKNKKKFYFVNRYFYPDHSATSQILSDLAFYLSSKGFNIEIITSRQTYDDSQAALSKTEVINGVKVNRLSTTLFGRMGLYGRSIDYLSFYISAFFYMLFNVRSNDVVVAKTDPPMLSIVVYILSKLKGYSYINWLQDLFPEIAKHLGVKGLALVYGPLRYIRNMSLKSAYSNVVIGEIMSDLLISEGVDKDRIRLIHNWSIEDNIYPITPNDNLLRKELKLDNKFIVGYSGNIGRAHEFDSIIDAAEKLRDKEDIVFIIIGGGAKYSDFRRASINRNLTNIMFLPYVPKDQLPMSLTLPDLHLISLLPELEGLIVPSKLYGILASGRPVLNIGSVEGEVSKTILDNACGIAAEIGDIDYIADSILKLKNDKKQLQVMCESSRNLYQTKYAKKFSHIQWHELLESTYPC